MGSIPMRSRHARGAGDGRSPFPVRPEELAVTLHRSRGARPWRASTGALVLAALLSRPVAAQAPGGPELHEYRILPESRFEVRTGTAGLLSGLGDAHVIRADTVEGTVRFAPGRVAASSVEVEVPAEGLRVETPVDPDDRAEIREAMLTEVLRAGEHPTIRFRSTAVEPAGDSLRIRAELTLAGTTRPVSLTLAYRSAVGRVWAWGTFRIRQTDFGIEPYSAGLGTVKVSDEVRFYVEAVAERTGSDGEEGPGLSRDRRSAGLPGSPAG